VTVSPNEEPTPPYAINIVASGAFAPASLEESPERIAKLAGVAGSSILHSAVRALVLPLPGRGRYGPFIPPTQNLVNLDFRKTPQPQTEATAERKVAKRRPASTNNATRSMPAPRSADDSKMGSLTAPRLLSAKA